MNKAQFLLVEPEDFAKPLYGGGGASVAASLMRTLGDTVAIVGTTSAEQTIGKWSTIECNGKRFRFLPVISRKTLENTRIGSLNVRFAIALLKCKRQLLEIGVRSIFTQTWSVLWFFSCLGRFWDICYYYPGFANAMRYGRKRVVGRIL